MGGTAYIGVFPWPITWIKQALQRTHAQVMAWEARHIQDCPLGPRLKRFLGKPNELSPKARLLNYMVRGAQASFNCSSSNLAVVIQ